MNVDKFGRIALHGRRKHGFSVVGYDVSKKPIDVKKRRITNLGEPREDSDAVTKEYLDKRVNEILLKREQENWEKTNKGFRSQITKTNPIVPVVNTKLNNEHKIQTDELINHEKSKLQELINDDIYGPAVERNTLSGKPLTASDPVTVQYLQHLVKDWRS
jgi:hypothetical protein